MMGLAQHWLNGLIEAESLSSVELNKENLEGFAAAVNQWQQGVQTHLPVKPSSAAERKAIESLQTYSEQLILKLTRFRAALQAEQQQLIKENLARSAYNKAR